MTQMTRSCMDLICTGSVYLYQATERLLAEHNDPQQTNIFVKQGPKTRRLSRIICGATNNNRREGFSSLKFFISAGVRKFVII